LKDLDYPLDICKEGNLGDCAAGDRRRIELIGPCSPIELLDALFDLIEITDTNDDSPESIFSLSEKIIKLFPVLET
jgi:hypothetical protein